MENKSLILNLLDEKIDIQYKNVKCLPLQMDEVRVKVAFSGINYKDRLAMNPASKVIRKYPMVPGIDFSGLVEESNSPQFEVGEQVFLTGLGYGTDRFGGFQEYVTVKENELCKVPDGLTLKEVMQIGTAGFTSALSVEAISEHNSLLDKEILVTGGTGGVSSFSIMILNKIGAHITVATRRLENADYLKSIGAHEVILFDTLLEKRKALSEEKWDGVIDATGGEATGNLLTEIRYGGSLAVSGNLSGIKFNSTVFPFILRGISLKGIDSVHVMRDKKMMLFNKMAQEWKLNELDRLIYNEIKFEDLKEELLSGINGNGRVLVSFN